MFEVHFNIHNGNNCESRGCSVDVESLRLIKLLQAMDAKSNAFDNDTDVDLAQAPRSSKRIALRIQRIGT